MTGAQDAYPPLQGASQTRVVRILPATPGSDDLICMSIEVIDLDDTPVSTYKALSYCCGEQTMVSAVYLENPDICVPIRKNLTEALARLVFDGVTGPIWIDAISINQGDDQERNQQVRLMTRIFQNAEETIAWLGEDDDVPAQTLELLARWANPCNDVDLSIQALNAAVEFPKTQDTTKICSTVSSLTSFEGWQSLKAFFDRPYFVRAWVVQEVVVSRRVRMLHGRWPSLEYLIVYMAAFWIMRYQHDHMLQAGDPAVKYVSRGSARLVSLHALRDTWRNDGSLPLIIMYRAIWNESWDPRDKYFAISGLFSFPTDVSRYFEVDYTKEDWLVCANATKGMIKGLKSLFCLSITNKTVSENTLFPTWVSRMDGPPSGFSQDADRESWNCEQDTEVAIPHSSPGTKPCMRESPNNRVLSLLGIDCSQIVGKVIDLVLRQLQDSNSPEDGLPWYTYRVPEVYSALRTQASDAAGRRGIATILAECTTMKYRFVTGTRQFSNDAVTIFADFKAYLQAWVEKMKQYQPINGVVSRIMADIDHDLGDWKILEAEEYAMGDALPVEGEMKRYYSSMAMYVGSRRFFASNTGSIGVGPADMQQGDQIVVFYGSARPFIVRKVKDSEQWNLIGPAWVSGLMDGEAPQWADKKERWFDLV